MTRKISITTGTRAEYGILRPLLFEIQNSKSLELYLLVTGMHLSEKYGKTINEIKKDGFKIFSKIPMMPNKDSTLESTKQLGHAIILFSQAFDKIKPDINLVLGDRDEMLASSIAAYHMNIPNAHIHGGDRSKGGIDEYNRHAITKMSNIHFAASKKSKSRIIKMGEDPKHVFFTGSPSIDDVVSKKIIGKEFLEKKYDIKFSGDEIILLQHSVTTQIDESEKQILSTLDAIRKIGKKTIAIAPNSDPGNSAIFRALKKYSKKFDFIKFYSNVPRDDYLGFLKYGGVLVGNSSSGMIEASYFGIPVINIGIRQIGREHGKNVIDVDHSSKKILQAIKKCLKTNVVRKTDKIYGDGNSSKIIIKYLENIKLNNDILKKQIRY
ncbi:MAG: UDP-N-acetylglucosamine 2-epimerase (hydrolyzing) [Nitrosopumilus sp.]|uniref:UDP-N-acetylglucosamine 2-epimerase n=1 Tax=Nitrosopumilus sp. TaxID=2024843 RepID=UPI00247E3D1B|nr:UDP-N-acetylglucosamine 2-epimerase [Nitrosopumilus sp.]MCV0393562.1 UDP-N-acetylglucosamine 2-epimerase (hydrolyzing) [Nitrosopumilus sp.]